MFMPRSVLAQACGVRPLHDKRDGDLVGAAGAAEMIADVAEHEVDLFEIDEVIDDLKGVVAAAATIAV